MRSAATDTDDGLSHTIHRLPTPSLAKRASLGVSFYTDEGLFDETGVRVAFTCRDGGVSEGGFASLNLGSHVDDDPAAVAANRKRALHALGAPEDTRLVVLDQVHGSDVLVVDEERAEALSSGMLEGPVASADAVVVDGEAHDVAAMLMYADCMPIVLVAPDGAFAVVHGGWRGVMARIVAKAAQELLARCGDARASDLNAYIGPCIRRECFEVSPELQERFVREFGEDAAFGERNVDLVACVVSTLGEAGLEPARICDVSKCTVCCEDEFFSYRASGGVCGRHGAVGFSVRDPEGSL